MIRSAIETRYADKHTHAPAHIVRAPGRANLIGDHTDYSDGFVMPFAIDRAIWLAVGPNDSATLDILSLDFGESEVAIPIDALRDEQWPHWTRAICGAWWLLRERGLRLQGANLTISGNVPIGAGLSSSAAIEVAAIEAGLALAGDESLSQREKALLAVEIEHKFLNMPSGVMDQMASAVSTAGDVAILDCRTLELTPVAMPPGVATVLVNSKVSHNLADSEYPVRRAQSEAAAATLGVSHLRDATLAQVEAAKQALGEVGYRRARHVVNENARVWAMKDALESAELETAGQLLNASHASLRDDYETSCDEVDTLQRIAVAHDGCYGARIMGGGFGGCVITLVDEMAVADFEAHCLTAYAAEVGVSAELYVVAPAVGAQLFKPD